MKLHAAEQPSLFLGKVSEVLHVPVMRKRSPATLGQAFLPEEADCGHNAATKQDSHSHAQEASSDSSKSNLKYKHSKQ